MFDGALSASSFITESLPSGLGRDDDSFRGEPSMNDEYELAFGTDDIVFKATYSSCNDAYSIVMQRALIFSLILTISFGNCLEVL